MGMSHETCNHPRTPAGRAACRKNGGPSVQTQINTKLDAQLDAAFGPVQMVVKTPAPRAPRTRGNKLAKPVKRDLDAVSMADMPRVFRTVVDWANTNGFEVRPRAGRNDQVQIYVVSPAGEAVFVYARSTPDGVNSTSFRPHNTPVARKMTVNEALAALRG